jgi:hypothetical protein
MLTRFASFVLGCALFVASCGGAQHARVSAGSMPPGGSFTGVWFSPQYGEMHMVENGATVIGRYTKDERTGRIQGSVEGDLMRFEWTENRELIVGRPVKTKGHGYFRIINDTAEGTWKLIGEWGNDDAETGGGQWNAVKSKSRKPDVDGNAGASSSEGSKSSSDEEESNTGSSGGGSDGLGDL